MATPWDFKFDPNTDDMTLDADYQLARTESLADIIADRIRTRLRTFRGEHFLDRDLGVPYFEEVLKKNPDVERVRNLLLAATAEVEGVLKVLSFDTTFDAGSRIFSVRFKVLADENVIVEGEV